MEASDHMKGIEFDQDTGPQSVPGGPAAAQAAAVEHEVEFQIGGNLDMGTAEEDFSPELVKAMEPPTATDSIPETGDDEPDDEEEDVVEILIPKSATRKWVIGPPGAQMDLYQKPLSFIGKMQWFGLAGDMLDKAMSGSNPLSLADLIDNPTAKSIQAGKAAEAVQMKNLRDADTFVRALGKIVKYAPGFLIDSYVIWLGATDEESLVREILNLPEEDGGLSDDMGMEMIEIFIDQNWDALARFFDRLTVVQKRVASQQETRRRKA